MDVTPTLARSVAGVAAVDDDGLDPQAESSGASTDATTHRRHMVPSGTGRRIMQESSGCIMGSAGLRPI
jgi:hypothetical protein